MTIVCGLDFSDASRRAAKAAALLAARTGMPMQVLHVMDLGGHGVYSEHERALVATAEKKMREEVELLRGLGASVDGQVRVGDVDAAVLRFAADVSARLVVIARGDGRTLGVHAERIAQHATVPVLTVADPEPFARWAQRELPLRILLCGDLSKSAEGAMQWIEQLRAFGPCDVLVAHLYWPPTQFRRLGFSGVRSYLEPDAEVTKALERSFAERFGRMDGWAAVSYRFEPHMGRVGDRLALMANEESADLVVVGCHHRQGVRRLWEGSVSRDLIRNARVSVVCVPVESAHAGSAATPLRQVLAATDFSPAGDASVSLAYGAVHGGGTVHLLHVLKGSKDPIAPHDIFEAPQSADGIERHRIARERLLQLVPHDFAGPPPRTKVHVVESADAALAICQAAARLDVDAVCLGTHGASRLRELALGSVAREVLQHGEKNVMLARPPKP